MNREKVQALMADAQEARATYQEAEAEYRKAAEVAFDTEFKTPDGTYALHLAARRSSAALAKYSSAVKELADYLKSDMPGRE